VSQRYRSRTDRRFDWAMELFFSWNLAWTAIWVLHSGAGTGAFLAFSEPIHKLYLYAHTLKPEVVVAQTAWSCVVAVALLLILRALGCFIATESWLRISGGVVALAAFPLTALVYRRFFFQPLAFEDRFAIGIPWLICELAIVLACAFLFYIRKPRLSLAVSIGLSGLHFAFWSWLTGMYVNPVDEARRYWSVRALHHGPLWLAFPISVWFFWGFPVLGFLATVTWAAYTRGQRGKRAFVAVPQPL
jgi:hypothetical protein